MKTDHIDMHDDAADWSSLSYAWFILFNFLLSAAAQAQDKVAYKERMKALLPQLKQLDADNV